MRLNIENKWLKLQDELDRHFAGPAFLPWGRMGNLRYAMDIEEKSVSDSDSLNQDHDPGPVFLMNPDLGPRFCWIQIKVFTTQNFQIWKKSNVSYKFFELLKYRRSI